jgi:hypothetical protein
VEIGGASALETASGITMLSMSLLVLLYGSYALLFQPAVVKSVKDLNTHEDYTIALNQYRDVKSLKNDSLLALDQLERIAKKKLALFNVLRQRFDPAELSYGKFEAAITEVEKLFYLNIRGMLNKLQVFDASGFANIAPQPGTHPVQPARIKEKTKLYEEYLAYITGYLGANEEILLKIDKLLLEISLLGSADYKDVEEMPCMREIDLLIKQTKYYKQ